MSLTAGEKVTLPERVCGWGGSIVCDSMLWNYVILQSAW